MPAPKDPEKYKQWIEKIRLTSTGRKIGPCSEEKKNKLREARKYQTLPMLGKRHSEETKKKISESKRGSCSNKGSFKKGNKPWNKGLPIREETREKLRQINMGKKHSEETKNKISMIMKGNKHRSGVKLSEKHKQAISNALTGNKNRLGHINSEEHRKRIGAAHKGKKHTLQTRLKMKVVASERAKKYWEGLPDEKKRERCSKWIKAGLDAFKNTKVSSLEIRIAELLDNMGEPYIQQHEFKGYFIDFYLLHRNQFIECNGTYWHNLPRRKDRDRKLSELCEKGDIKLSWLWEEEIKQDAKNALLNVIN